MPAPDAPSLTAVLTTNNVSQNKAIIIQQNDGTPVCTLGSNSSTPNAFALKSSFTDELSVGSSANILLQPDGTIIGAEADLLGNATTTNALRVFPAGTTNATIGSATPTVTITNAGAATFSGALEALSIDGGVYAQ